MNLKAGFMFNSLTLRNDEEWKGLKLHRKNFKKWLLAIQNS